MKQLYELYSGEELSIAEKIWQRRQQMIVHSRLYYILDENIVSDAQWAKWGKELQSLQERYPAISDSVPMAEYFANWDASTGMDLPINEPWVVAKAEMLLSHK